MMLMMITDDNSGVGWRLRSPSKHSSMGSHHVCSVMTSDCPSDYLLVTALDCPFVCHNKSCISLPLPDGTNSIYLSSHQLVSLASRSFVVLSLSSTTADRFASHAYACRRGDDVWAVVFMTFSWRPEGQWPLLMGNDQCYTLDLEIGTATDEITTIFSLFRCDYASL